MICAAARWSVACTTSAHDFVPTSAIRPRSSCEAPCSSAAWRSPGRAPRSGCWSRSSRSGATGVGARVKIASLRVREVDNAIAQYQIEHGRCPTTPTIWPTASSSTREISSTRGIGHPVHVHRRGHARRFCRAGQNLRDGRRHHERALTCDRPSRPSQHAARAAGAAPKARPSRWARPRRRRRHAARRGAPAVASAANKHPCKQCQIKTALRLAPRPRRSGLRQLATMPAETVPNQDGTAAAEAALSPGSARVGWPANRRRAQAERPRARRLACQQTSARPGPPRPRHPPRRPRSPVAPIRKRLSGPETRARTIEPKHISRASFLRTDRSRPPRRRGERAPVPCTRDSGPRWTLRKAINRASHHRGRVWTDRYHARALRTPREVRTALVYVLQNFRKHLRAPAVVDPCSSGPWFDGWARAIARRAEPAPTRPQAAGSQRSAGAAPAG